MYNLLNKLLNKADAVFMHIKMVLVTRMVVFSCRLRGIKFAKPVLFYGFPKFFRVTDSVIQIGKSCSFRSYSTSNLIGVHHKCIVAAHLPGAVLKIGDHCGFSGVTIGCFKEIIIGNNVRCGANVLITDSDWHLNDVRVGEPKRIEIGNNVWLGYGAIIMKGTTIGENSIIGAGSVVTADIPANVIAAGNPCRIIKKMSI